MHEMITMVNIKNSGQSGNTKKMLHAPTLKLFVLKEIPLDSKEVKMNIRNYVEDWVRHSSSLYTLLNVNEVFWNTPEGFVSIVTENCVRGSLKDLLDKVESLPEAALIPLAKDLLVALALFHGKFHTPFRSLSLRQILFNNRGELKISFGFSRRLHYLSIKSKNNKEKEFLNVDSFEVGLILLKCAVGDLLDEFLSIVAEIFQKELFMTTKECTAVSEKNKIDVFRILDNYPIKNHQLIITEKLSEHYSSLYKFMLGELRDHVRHNYFDTMLAKDKLANLKIKAIRKMAKAKLSTQFSTGFGNLLKWLTKFDSEDRCLPQDALSLEYLKQGKVKFGHIELDKMQLVANDLAQKDQQETGLSESNLYLEKLMNSLGLMYENGEKWYELESAPERASQELSLPFGNARKARPYRYTPDSEQMQELCQELGCSKQALWLKLKKMDG